MTNVQEIIIKSGAGGGLDIAVVTSDPAGLQSVIEKGNIKSLSGRENMDPLITLLESMTVIFTGSLRRELRIDGETTLKIRWRPNK